MESLKRTTLDELAKKMPVIERKEQSECVGRNYAFSFSGDFFGKYGGGQDIVLVTPEGLSGFLANEGNTWYMYWTSGSNGSGYFTTEGLGGGTDIMGIIPSTIGLSGMELRGGIMNALFKNLTIEYTNCGNYGCQAYISEIAPAYGSCFDVVQIGPATSYGGAKNASYILFYPIQGEAGAFDNADSLMSKIKSVLAYQ